MHSHQTFVQYKLELVLHVYTLLHVNIPQMQVSLRLNVHSHKILVQYTLELALHVYTPSHVNNTKMQVCRSKDAQTQT